MQSETRARGGRPIARAAAWIVAGGLVLLGFFSEAKSGLNGDSAWLLYVTSRVSQGSRLYIDLVEVNPPLVVWLNLPLVWLARGLGWSEIAVYRGAVWAAVGVSLWLTGHLLHRALDREDATRRRWLLLAAVLLLAMPGPYFGQREHVTLVLILPWLTAAGARLRAQRLAVGTSAAVGIMAAAGIALKPHYVLLPLGVALYVRLASPGRKHGVPPEQSWAAAALLVYAIAVMAVAPQYPAVVSRLGATYWDYSRKSLTELLFGGLAPLTIVGSLLVWPFVRRLTRYPALADLLGIATVGLLAAVVLQHKGFGYHYYPALGTGLLALVLGLTGGAEPAPATWLRVVGRTLVVSVALPCVAVLFITAIDRAAGGAARGPGSMGKREIGGFLRAHRPAGAVAVFSPWMEDSFPIILESGVPWASRYPFMWFLPALHRDELRSGTRRVTCLKVSRHASAQRALVGSVSEDLRRHRPELVFVRRPGEENVSRVDVLACLSRDSTFRREFAAYRPRAELEHFRVFERLR